MGPKSQQGNDQNDSSLADASLKAGLEGALFSSPKLADRLDQSVASPESWAAKPVNQKEQEIAQKENLDFDAVRIFIVLGLLTAAMAVVMKFLF
jgi:hypothetical protein